MSVEYIADILCECTSNEECAYHAPWLSQEGIGCGSIDCLRILGSRHMG